MTNNNISYFYDLSPTEFEKYCLEILRGYAESENLNNFSIEHDKKIKVSDGKYQIDVYATFEALGCQIKVLCECKRYKNPVSREKIIALHDKLNSTGSNKGILLTNNRFQSGAIEYAKQHGIALITVHKKDIEHVSHSNGTEKYDDDDPFLYQEKHFPPYKAVLVTEENEADRVVYPTKTMLKAIYKETNRLVKEKLGIEIDMSFLDSI